MRLILESANDLANVDPYWDRIEKLLVADYSIHRDTVQYWVSDDGVEEDNFYLTPAMRNLQRKIPK